MGVSHIFCEDTRVSKKLLNLLQTRYNLTCKPKKYISFHSHNEDEVIKSLDIKALHVEDFAFVSDAGMPGISDPGSKLIKFCQENKIAYEVLPGANAVLLAYVASGFLSPNFTFFGFLPHKGQDRQNKLKEIINHPNVSILYESPHRIELLAKELSTYLENRELFFIKEATKKHEKYYKCKSEQIYEIIKNANQKGEWAVVIDKNPNPTNTNALHVEDIINLELKPKQKAKLLAKITGENAQIWYKKLCNEPKNS